MFGIPFIKSGAIQVSPSSSN